MPLPPERVLSARPVANAGVACRRWLVVVLGATRGLRGAPGPPERRKRAGFRRGGQSDLGVVCPVEGRTALQQGDSWLQSATLENGRSSAGIALAGDGARE